MPSWQDISADPNAPQTHKWRNDALAAAHRPPVENRIEFLREAARGKRVLDVGVVNHLLNLDDPNWLHGAIASSASYCLGVDILPDAVATLQAAGYNVRLCDITRDVFEESFDLIVAGELIEHLADPGALFRAAARWLNPAGRLVFTTPNPHYLRRMRDAIRDRHMDSTDHTVLLYPSGVAELAHRHGLELCDFRGISVRSADGIVGKAVLALRGLLVRCGASPDVFCGTMIYECRKV